MRDQLDDSDVDKFVQVLVKPPFSISSAPIDSGMRIAVAKFTLPNAQDREIRLLG